MCALLSVFGLFSQVLLKCCVWILHFLGGNILRVPVGVLDMVGCVVGVNLGDDAVKPAGVEFLSHGGSDCNGWI